MEHTGKFPHGIINIDGVACCDFVLQERAFRHTLQLANDRTINKDLLADPAYYDAAIISKRLTVTGIEKLTPEMVLDLEGPDGDELADALMDLDKRRSEFRKAQQPAS